MDAFGVSVSVGLNDIKKRYSDKSYIISFSFFQFLLAFVGGGIGYFFHTYIISIPKWVSPVILFIVALMILKDDDSKAESSALMKKTTVLLLGISVSIDALVVGFTVLPQFQNLSVLLVNCIIIGLVTLLLTTFGFFICGYFKKIKIIETYSRFIGAFFLILIATKMIFE